MRWIDSFSVLLLDMHGTFMFRHDRFGPDEDYYATYRTLGGSALDRERATSMLSRSYDILIRDYDDPERFDDFPSLAEALKQSSAPEDELEVLEQTFAAHEMGYVPVPHAAFLRQVAATHHLGIVSNICARPQPWLDALGSSGLLPLFGTLVFSSEGRSIKPSPKIFERALADLAPGSAVAFVGDSLHRDIIPAKALGLATAWIAPEGSDHPSADVVVSSLSELLDVV